MEESRTYYPPRQMGTIIHLLLLAAAAAAGGWGIWGVSNAEVTVELLPFISLIGFFLIAFPTLIYSLYSLHRSAYVLSRSGIQLVWGWRSELLPIQEVKWVYRVEDLETPPQLPLIHWPGAVTGIRRFQRGPEVEFLASKTKGLIILAVDDRYYAISPQNGDEFLASFQQLTEMGSITPLQAETIRPTLIINEIIDNRPILWILVSGALLNILLLIWTLMVIPSRELVSLGFDPSGQPQPGFDSVRLVLFPIINTTSYLTNLILGLFLFRNEENRYLAFILWGGSLVVAILFHIAMLFILN
jgi:hypothetical protein